MLTESLKKEEKIRAAKKIRTDLRMSLKYWERIERKLVREQNKVYHTIVKMTSHGYTMCDNAIDIKLHIYMTLSDQISTASEEALACQETLYKIDKLISICEETPL